MSKSMGNIIPLRKAIREYNADSIRVAMLVLGELLQDVDFSISILRGIYSKLNEIYNFYSFFYKENEVLLKKSNTAESIGQGLSNATKLKMEDKWLLASLNKNIDEVTKSFDALKIRDAINIVLYLMDKDFEWYKRRKIAKQGKLYQNENDLLVIYEFMVKRIQLLAPFCPFLCEELWSTFGDKSSIFKSMWPAANRNGPDYTSEENEQFIANVLADINKILKVTKKNNDTTPAQRIFIYLASEQKQNLYVHILQSVSNSKNKNFGEVMKTLLSPNSTLRDDLKTLVKKNPDFVKKTIDDILSLSPTERQRRLNDNVFDEQGPLQDAVSLLAAEFNVQLQNIHIYRENQEDIVDPINKSRFSRPYKPAIFIE